MNRHLFPFERARKWTVDFAARSARTLALDRPVPYLARVVLLAAVYFAAAKLSLLVAIPPGYATAIWPPSGIALAALLLWGNLLWPGVWLGSFAANLTVEGALLASTVIATGSSLQAFAIATLVRR